ncbi:MAG: 3-deoxy-D-manno-octulosonic acid transferase [Beijerinckiaceae bacterium]
MPRFSLFMRAYGGVSSLLYPAVRPLLNSRRKKGKEDAVRLPERKGIASLPRPEGVLIWLHGASVGEVISLLPIAEHFTSKGVHVMVTSGTVTSAEVAARRLPKGAFHQFVPLDLPAYVKRFLDHWKPDIGVFAESELWPNLVHAAQKSGTHLVIVNGRMSERSFNRWKRLPSFITSMLSRFELVLAQTEADGDRLRLLGAPRVQTIGNLKYDVTPPPADAAKLAALSAATKGRPVFVAASTHPGEEEQVAEAHRIAKAAVPGLLTVLIPRHPGRGAEVAELVFKTGLSVARRSEGALPDIHTDIYVADTIGELGLFYRLSSLSYLGGSLVMRGGQNPIEPAKLGNGILYGPNVHNFTEVFEALATAKGAFMVQDADALGQTVGRLIRDEKLLSRMAEAAAHTVEAMSGANQRAIDALEPFLVQAHLERAAQDASR